MWDLVVVGAGPAGSAAALAALRRDPAARVLLLDRSAFPRDKPCGDGVAPHALDVLAGLGVHGLTDGFRPVDRLALGFADGSPVRRRMRRPAHVVPREVLDHRLVSAAVARGARLEQHRVRSVEVRPDHVVLDGEIASRTVVAADGANSILRRRLRVADNRPGTVAVALRGYAPVSPVRPDEQVIVFAAEGWPAYAWSFPIGDGRANVGYGEVLPPGRPVSRTRLVAGLETLLPGAGAGGESWRAHHLPLSSGRPRQPEGRVLLAGDAMSLVNPLTGEGIFYAVLSGALAGDAAGAVDPARTYRTALRRELARHLRHTSVAAALAGRRPVVEAGIAAARRSPRVFEDLVEVGLGKGLLRPRSLGSVVTSGASAVLYKAWTS